MRPQSESRTRLIVRGGAEGKYCWQWEAVRRRSLQCVDEKEEEGGGGGEAAADRQSIQRDQRSERRTWENLREAPLPVQPTAKTFSREVFQRTTCFF